MHQIHGTHDGVGVGTQPHGRMAPTLLALGDLARAQPSAGSWIAVGHGVWSLAGLGDLTARAEARVGQPGSPETFLGLAVPVEPFGLADRVLVPVDADRSKVGSLGQLVVATRRHPIEILEAQQERTAVLAGMGPCRQRGA
jgi:hypothetical protein